MRSSKSRSRSKGNRNRSVGNIVNRVFDSSGPEGKVRGTPQQIIEKYTQLTRDAQVSNDRVAAENFAQHAEHYTRMLGEAQREADARRDQQEQQQTRERPQGQHQGQNQNHNQGNDGNGSGQESGQGGHGGHGGHDVSHNGVPGTEPQPDIYDVPDDEDSNSGLVETPESRPAPRDRDNGTPRGDDRSEGGATAEDKPERPKRSRKPRAKPEGSPEGAAPVEGSDERPAPKPRRARKPVRNDGDAPDSNGSSEAAE